jgi:diacylglycerol kinase (ATP)
MSATPRNEVHVQKRRTGGTRLWHATLYSLQGLRSAWSEAAFRQESYAAAILLPASIWLGRTWVETALLAGSWVLVMIVELLNSAIESSVDRVGPEFHTLSKRAKDLASAAVLLSLLLSAAIWFGAIASRLMA